MFRPDLALTFRLDDRQWPRMTWSSAKALLPSVSNHSGNAAPQSVVAHVAEQLIFRGFLCVGRNSLEAGREILHPRTVLVEIVQANLGPRAEVDEL